MSKKSIIVLVIFTIILIIISITTVHSKPDILAAYITDSKPPPEKDLEELPLNPQFSKPDDIFLIIQVEHIRVENEIKVIWKKNENGKKIKIQEDKIIPAGNGSGILITSLAKRDKKIMEGQYEAEVFLNQNLEIKKEFVVQN